MDVGMSLWLPGGELGEYRAMRPQHEIVDTTLEVGAVRYEMLEAMRSWRLTIDGDVPARPVHRGAASDRDAHVRAGPPLRRAARRRSAPTAVGGSGPRSAEAAAAAEHVGKGHFEQAGVVERLDGGRRRAPRVERRAAATATAPGGRAGGAGRGCGGGSASTSTRRCTSVASGSAPTPATSIGAGCGTAAARRACRVAPANRARGRRADPASVHLTCSTRRGGPIDLLGDVQRVADIGRTAGTLVNEGLARWTYRDADGATRSGYGICEYLHQLDAAGRPVVAVVEWCDRPTTKWPAARHGPWAGPWRTSSGSRAVPRASPAPFDLVASRWHAATADPPAGAGRPSTQGAKVA